MTIDELLQQLMKIKEIYPDSGKFPIVAYDTENDTDYDLNKIIKHKINNEILIQLVII